MIKQMLQTCTEVINNRDVSDVFTHALSEFDELDEEITKCREDDKPGEDGIVGEAVDVIWCMIDIIYKSNPNIAVEDIENVIVAKGEKWKRIYHEG